MPRVRQATRQISLVGTMNTLTCIDGPNRGLTIERQGLPLVLAIHGYWYERTSEKRDGRTCYRVQRNNQGEPTPTIQPEQRNDSTLPTNIPGSDATASPTAGFSAD